MPDQLTRGFRRWPRLTAAAMGLLVAAYVAWPIYLAGVFTHPPRAPLDGASPAGVGLAYQDVALTASDGVSIATWYVPSTNGAAIVLVHGIGENRAQLLPIAAAMAKHGYGIILIDMRAHGDSGGDAWSSWLSERDILAAVDFLKSQPEVDQGRIGALGFSAGASAVLHAAARTDDIAAVIADAPAWTLVRDEPIDAYPPQKWLVLPQDWIYETVSGAVYLRGMGTPTGIIDDVAMIAPRPLLLIAGEDNPNEVRFAQNYLAHAGEPKDLWLLSDAGHADKWARHPEEYEQHIRQFFDVWLIDK